MFEDYKKLPKEIYTLSIATLINRTGDFVVPFLTLYLSQKLAISLPITGIIVAVAGFIKIPGSFLGGKLNDLYNSKIVYVTCQAIGGLLLIPCAFIKNPFITVPILILFSFVTSMVKAPTMAMISDLLPNHQRKAGFTLRYIGINIGVAVGLIIAGFLYNHSTIILFLGDAITMLISVTLIAFGIRSSDLKKIREDTIGKNEQREEGHIFNILSKRKPLVLYMFFSSMLMIVFTQTQFALPLTMEMLFNVDGPVFFGFLISINAVTATIIALLQHRFTKHIKPINQMVIGGLMFGIGFSCYAVTTTFTTFALATIFWSIGEVLIFTNNTVFVINHSPENFRGRLSSLYSIFFSIMGTLGIIITERLISVVGLLNTWIWLGIMTMFASVMLLLLKIKYYSRNGNEQ